MEQFHDVSGKISDCVRVCVCVRVLFYGGGILQFSAISVATSNPASQLGGCGKRLIAVVIADDLKPVIHPKKLDEVFLIACE